MMIVVSMIGLLATIAAPPMYRYIQSNRLQTNTDRMVADLQYARAIAITNGSVIDFSNTEGGYTLTNLSSGLVLRQQNLEDGLSLDIARQIRFYPWGMADAAVYNLSSSAGAKQIDVLPTGIVEVTCP
jgi:type II secretory pathway pseudopilin PulG